MVLRRHSPNKSIFFKKWPRNLIFDTKTAIEAYLKEKVKKSKMGKNGDFLGFQDGRHHQNLKNTKSRGKEISRSGSK